MMRNLFLFILSLLYLGLIGCAKNSTSKDNENTLEEGEMPLVY